MRAQAQRFNIWLAEHITAAVGTMWCAYVFTAIALIALPSAIQSGSPVVLVAWVSSNFLQLVLLSVIMLGQDIQAKGTQKVIVETHDTVMTSHTELKQSHTEHSAKLDELIRAVPGANPPSVSIHEGAANDNHGPV